MRSRRESRPTKDQPTKNQHGEDLSVTPTTTATRYERHLLAARRAARRLRGRRHAAADEWRPRAEGRHRSARRGASRRARSRGGAARVQPRAAARRHAGVDPARPPGPVRTRDRERLGADGLCIAALCRGHAGRHCARAAHPCRAGDHRAAEPHAVPDAVLAGARRRGRYLPARADRGRGSRRRRWSSFSRTCGGLRPYTLDERSEQIINLKDAQRHRRGCSPSTPCSPTGWSSRSRSTASAQDADPRRAHELRLLARARRCARRPTASSTASIGAEARGRSGRSTSTGCATGTTSTCALRGYGSPIAVRNVDNDIPDGAVDALLEVGARTRRSSSATSG